MNSHAVPSLSVHVERRRSELRVIAREAESHSGMVIELTYSGGPERVGFQIIKAGRSRVFASELIARHPALSAVLRLIADEVELAKPGKEALLSFLFRSLLIYVQRMKTPVPLPKWGRPLRDLPVERSLALLNENIQKRWTVELLAKAVGLSRPVFARRFQRVLGFSPIRYLTQRRMQLAAALLFGSDAGLAEVASRVGYDSEYAFNRAFKKHYGVPPGRYRQRPTALSTRAAVVACRMAA